MAVKSAGTSTGATRRLAALPNPDAPRITAFGELIKQYRKEKGMSQQVLADRTPCSGGYVGLIETGQRGDSPSLEMVKKFAQALECTMEQTEALLRAAGHLAVGETLLQAEKPTFQQVVSSDPRLTKMQKQGFLTMYEAIVGKS